MSIGKIQLSFSLSSVLPTLEIDSIKFHLLTPKAGNYKVTVNSLLSKYPLMIRRNKSESILIPFLIRLTKLLQRLTMLIVKSGVIMLSDLSLLSICIPLHEYF